jgi:hypothetical protein
MHECKWAEHDRETCPEAIVSCTNASFGCKELLKRRNLASHIAHCPASILHCRFTYSRHVAAKLGECALEEPSSVIDKKMLEGDMNLLRDSPQLPCLGLSMENESYLLKYIQVPGFSMPAHTRFSTSTGAREYAFSCNQAIRRDEFHTHWLSYHLEVQLGPLVKRCPLTLYGCTYGQEVLAPSPPGATLNFDKETDTFLVTSPQHTVTQSSTSQYEAKIKEKQELSAYGYGDDEESYDVLGQLPLEILLCIFQHVDSLSLWNLSLVNHYFRKVCVSILSKKKGIVYNKWTKDPGANTWSVERVCH